MLLLEIKSVTLIKKRSSTTNAIQLLFAISSIALLSLDWFVRCSVALLTVYILTRGTTEHLQRLDTTLEHSGLFPNVSTFGLRRAAALRCRRRALASILQSPSIPREFLARSSAGVD